jgi:hypothetical protein
MKLTYILNSFPDFDWIRRIDGAVTNQQIVLIRVDLTDGGTSSGQDILNTLLSSGNLSVDQSASRCSGYAETGNSVTLLSSTKDHPVRSGVSPAGFVEFTSGMQGKRAALSGKLRQRLAQITG